MNRKGKKNLQVNNSRFNNHRLREKIVLLNRKIQRLDTALAASIKTHQQMCNTIALLEKMNMCLSGSLRAVGDGTTGDNFNISSTYLSIVKKNR